ncbi:MAG: metal-dependent phosphohydrolase, partial [Actinobacteria bacterium]|nr:metal-dependent phosphohydrolase [Actinomycetota bacterium]NCV09502.1 metal-dependent phosphohydrolase [Actinomycetota bacterium]
MSLESRDEFLAGVRSLYERWGTNKYDEQVSQIEHAVQCAQHARD